MLIELAIESNAECSIETRTLDTGRTGAQQLITLRKQLPGDLARK